MEEPEQVQDGLSAVGHLQHISNLGGHGDLESFQLEDVETRRSIIRAQNSCIFIWDKSHHTGYHTSGILYVYPQTL